MPKWINNNSLCHFKGYWCNFIFSVLLNKPNKVNLYLLLIKIVKTLQFLKAFVNHYILYIIEKIFLIPVLVKLEHQQQPPQPT